MGTDSNDCSSDEISNINLESSPRKNIDKDIPIIGMRSRKDEASAQIQKRMVINQMHKAMSPISAISGYLELMKMLLENDPTNDSIERYRSKVEDGINELGEIVEELYDAFDDSGSRDKKTSNSLSGAEADTGRRAS